MKKKYVYLPLLIFVITIIFTGGLVFAHGGTKESKNPNNYLSKIQTKIDLVVKEGKITQEQANEKLKALKSKSDKNFNKNNPHNKYLIGIDKKLHLAIKEGKITQEQADEKLKNLKYISGIKKRLDLAVKEGKITQEQADTRLRGFKSRFSQ